MATLARTPYGSSTWTILDLLDLYGQVPLGWLVKHAAEKTGVKPASIRRQVFRLRRDGVVSYRLGMVFRAVEYDYCDHLWKANTIKVRHRHWCQRPAGHRGKCRCVWCGQRTVVRGVGR